MSIKDRLQAAKQPTLDRITDLIPRTSRGVKALLKQIAADFSDSNCEVFEIRRDSGTTEWDSKVFKRELGMTPWDLVQECRAEFASVLLRDTRWTIGRIAGHVGYKSVSAFRRAYKTLTGLPPSHMRTCLRRIDSDYRALGDELLSWYFWVRYHRKELLAVDFRAALVFLRERFGRNCSV